MNGSGEIAWRPYSFNALHPKVQAKYIELVGELADQFRDCPSFAGISCRLMLDWQWAGFNALPGLKYGYDDFTVALFEKETGIEVPAPAGRSGPLPPPFRFPHRFAKGGWLAWRCEKIFDLHKRLLKRIRQANPRAKLFLTYFGPSTWRVLATDTLGQMREIGMDPARYAAEPGIVVIQGRHVWPTLFHAPGRRTGDRAFALRSAGYRNFQVGRPGPLYVHRLFRIWQVGGIRQAGRQGRFHQRLLRRPPASTSASCTPWR